MANMQRETYCETAMGLAMQGGEDADLFRVVDRALRADVADSVEFSVTKYVWVPANAAKAAGAQPAAEALNGAGWFVYSFPDNLRRQIQASIILPDDMDRSAPCTLCVGWSTPANGQNVVLDLHYLITAADDDTEGAGTTSAGNVFTASAVADGLTRNDIVTIAGGVIGENDVCIHAVLERDGANVLDTLNDVMELHGIALRYVSNRLGA